MSRGGVEDRPGMGLEYNGEKHTVSEWADILGINRSTLNNRVHRGWTAEKALARRSYRVSVN